MSGRRLYAAATIVVVVGLTAAAALLWGGYPAPAGTLVAQLVVTLAVGWSFAGLGLVGWRRRPASLAGPLMVAVGLAWFARALGVVQNPWSFNAGLLIGTVYLAVLAHLVVTYPSGRIITRSQGVVVTIAYLCTVPLTFVGHWLIPSSEPCPGCPHNLLMPDPPAAAPSGGHQVLYGLVVAATAAVLIVMVRRWWAATAAGRRSYAPAVGGATLILVVVAVHRLSVVLGVSASASTVLSWAVTAVLVLWPLGLVVGLARERLDRSAVADLVVELGGPLPPGRMRDALAAALHDRSLDVVFWLPDRGVWVQESGETVDAPREDAGRYVTILARDGDTIAALIHDPVLADQPGLVSSVAAAAALAMENERLHAQARAHLIDTMASRTRIVAAASAERRRVERNLHDGAQQRMLNLMLALRLAKVRLGAGGYEEADTAIDAAGAELTSALSELRELARGIHPAVLTHAGLGPAVLALAQRSSVPVLLTDDLGKQRFREGVEETAYFIISEALANVSKHAHATQAIVRIRERDGDVIVDVTDDGIGGADMAAGEGLRGLQDRVEAYSGRLHIDSQAGNGTHLMAALPCA
jgi:signal transduction histidine kinase